MPRAGAALRRDAFLTCSCKLADRTPGHALVKSHRPFGSVGHRQRDAGWSSEVQGTRKRVRYVTQARIETRLADIDRSTIRPVGILVHPTSSASWSLAIGTRRPRGRAGFRRSASNREIWATASRPGLHKGKQGVGCTVSCGGAARSILTRYSDNLLVVGLQVNVVVHYFLATRVDLLRDDPFLQLH